MARQTRPQPQTLPATQREPRQAGEIVAYLNERRRALAEILPSTFGPDRMVALALQSLRRNPALLNCTPDSILSAVFECAKLNLEPDTPAQLCHLVPYKNECQFVLGYQGAKVLCMRSGEIAKIWAEHRHANDHFVMTHGLEPNLEHIRADGDRGEYLGTYAVAVYKYPRVRPSFEYLDRDEMDKIEAHAHGCAPEQLEAYREREGKTYKKEKPWFKWRDRMRLKTAIKRLAKQLTFYDSHRDSGDIRHALNLDDHAEARKTQVKLSRVPATPDFDLPEPPPEDPREHKAVEAPAEPAPEPSSDDAATLTEIGQLFTTIVDDHPDMHKQAMAITSDPKATPAEKLAELRKLSRFAEGLIEE